MKLTGKIVIILPILFIFNAICFSQSYTVSIDTLTLSDSTFQTQIIIDDSPSDSLKYEVIQYNFNNLDSTIVFQDTFYYHNPNVLAFDYINFRHQTGKTLLSLEKGSIIPFVIYVRVLTKSGVLEEELIFNDYE
ncbi:MAG: hypothetical protein WED10_00045 [Brumimicrobium sp.]